MPDFSNDIEQCLDVLRSGGVILYPTDTVWGIGCDATDSNAVEKIYSLKKRNNSKAMIILATEEQDILKYTASPDLALFDYLDLQTKPTTVVYDGAIGLAENLVAPDGSVAIRICKESFCRTLIKRLGKPIVSTSANIAGEETPANFGTISDEIKKGVDYIVQYRQDDENPAQPSSVIRWRNGNPEILRP